MADHGHATFSPSSAHRWIECPGSVRLTAGMSDDSSPAAAEGTFAHGVAAICLHRGYDAKRMLGYSDVLHTVDDEMAKHVQTYLDIARELPARARFVERRVDLLGVCEDVWGTLDFGALSLNRKRLDVVDFKYGAGVYVPVQQNPQLMSYGLGALLSLPEAADVEEVGIHVVQPRHHKGGHETEEHSANALRAWGSTILSSAVARAKEPNAPLHAGEHCKFCRARPFCPELKRASLERVQHLFEDETLAVPAKLPPPPATMTPDEIGVALKAFPVIEEWISAVREHAYLLSARGQVVPGFKLVEKTGHRKWIDPDVTRLVLEAHGVNPFEDPKLVTPAAAERLLPKDERGIIEKLATKPVTGTTLAPMADPRPALSRGPDVFGDGEP